MLDSRRDQISLDGVIEGRHGDAVLVIETVHQGTVLRSMAFVSWSKGGGMTHAEGEDFLRSSCVLRPADKPHWDPEDLDRLHAAMVARIPELASDIQRFYQAVAQ